MKNKKARGKKRGGGEGGREGGTDGRREGQREGQKRERERDGKMKGKVRKEEEEKRKGEMEEARAGGFPSVPWRITAGIRMAPKRLPVSRKCQRLITNRMTTDKMKTLQGHS